MADVNDRPGDRPESGAAGGSRGAGASTRRKLVEGALVAVQRHGIAGVSARTVAAAAEVNQALVFYHFGSVHGLLAQMCQEATVARVELYRPRFERVTSLRELLQLGRVLHEEERAAGNVNVLAQLLAGAQSDPALTAPVAAALDLWAAEIAGILTRLLAGSPLAELVDAEVLAPAVCAAFIGLELYEGVDTSGANDALDALERLSVLVDVLEDLGPIGRRAVRARVRRYTNTARTPGSSTS